MNPIEINEPSYVSAVTKKDLGVPPKPTKFGTIHFRLHEEILARLKNEAHTRDISMPSMIELILVERYENITKQLG